MKKLLTSSFCLITIAVFFAFFFPTKTEAAKAGCTAVVDKGQVTITLHDLDPSFSYPGDKDYFIGIWPEDCKSFNGGNTKLFCNEVHDKPDHSSETTAQIRADVFHGNNDPDNPTGYYVLVYKRKWGGCRRDCGTHEGSCYFTITEDQGARPCGDIGTCGAQQIAGCTEEKLECCELVPPDGCLAPYIAIPQVIPAEVEPNTGVIITPWSCDCRCLHPSAHTPYDPCKDLPDSHPDSEQRKCYECHVADGVWTAVGCIPPQPAKFVAILIRIGFGIGGGLAFLFMIVGAFKILTSEGNPETINDGRQMIVNAIAGLVLIIFSVVVLKIIGVDVLQLPGFVSP